MGKFRYSLKVSCMYYDGERPQELYCMGLEEGSRIHVGFAHPGMSDDWKGRYCEKCPKGCPIFAMLAEHGVEPKG